MSVLEIFRWIQDTPPAAALRGSALVYPIVMTGHLTGMGLFGGMIAITDARLLGLAMRKYPIADLVNQLRVWKRIGGVLGDYLRSDAAGVEGGAVLLQPFLLAEDVPAAVGGRARFCISQRVRESRGAGCRW